MDSIAGDARYQVSYRGAWGATDGPIGHLVIRRLDDHEVVAEVPAADEAQARALLARAEAEIRGSAAAFEASWGLEPVEPPALRPAVSPAPSALVVDDRREPLPGEPLLAPDPRVRVLPDPAEVFATDQPGLAKTLHPLVSVELSAIDPAWTGRVHVLSPVEPADGLLGEATTRHHDELADTNWIVFRLEDGHRHRFLGRPGYFELDAHALDGTPAPAELEELYARAETEFAAARRRWERLGELVPGDAQDPSSPRAGWTPSPVVDQLGGEPGYGNWAAFPPPAAFRLDETDPATPVLRLADGRPFAFVCATAGYPWREHGADAILVFFEPETRTVALTFDWS